MRRIGTELGIMAAIGVVAALIGPFGTYSLPIPARLADWLLFAFGGYLFFRPVIAGGEALARQTAMPRWAGLLVANLLGALPTTLLVAWALSGMRLGRVTVDGLAAFYPQVLLVGGIVTAILVLIRTPHQPSPVGMPPPRPPEPRPAEEVPAVSADAPPSFLDRLPPHLGTELLALENEDHYVRVHTAIGSVLVLMRMRDAVAALAGRDGWRVHRSWWVARAAVAEVVRRDRAMALRLSNGLEVPVARNEVPALRAEGWLQAHWPSRRPPL